MTDQKHIPPVTPKNFVVRYKASVERAFKNADVKFLSIEDDKWERLMESLSAEANKLLANFQPSPPSPSPQTGEKGKDDLLDCPFCGGRPEWINLAHPSGIPALHCPECQFSIQQDRRDKTWFYWNRRALHQPPAAQSDQEAAEKARLLTNEAEAMRRYPGNNNRIVIMAERAAFLDGCTHVRGQQQEGAGLISIAIKELETEKGIDKNNVNEWYNKGLEKAILIIESIQKSSPRSQQPVDAVAQQQLWDEIVSNIIDGETSETLIKRFFLTARHPTPKPEEEKS